MMEIKISRLSVCFDEVKEWGNEASLMKREKKIWSLKDFTVKDDEKDDRRETTLALIRLTKVVAEEN
jgi:hypothetical protein